MKIVIRPGCSSRSRCFPTSYRSLETPLLKCRIHNDQLFAKLTNNKPAFCPEYSKTENYISDVRRALLGLKNHFNANLLEAGSGGYQYISHLIFSKLSLEIQNALINKLSKNYATIDKIYDNHIEVIHSLKRSRRYSLAMLREAKSNSLDPLILNQI